MVVVDFVQNDQCWKEHGPTLEPRMALELELELGIHKLVFQTSSKEQVTILSCHI